MARRALGPAGLAVVQAVEAGLDGTESYLLVACSGGADSLALAVATQHVAGRRSLRYGAVVVDHGLQPGSSAVAAATVERLTRLGYAEAVTVPVRVDLAAGSGPEAAAREARYAALDRAARERSAVVLLGHTRDDQAETVLLGLARGSGTRSLAGMAPRVAHLRRPLLELPRAVTEQACAEAGLEAWADPHNADPAYARVRVRRTVLPLLERELGPGVAEALSRTAELARDDADLLDELAAAADPGTDDLDCRALADLPRALRRRVLRRWLHRHGAADLGYRHLVAVEGLALPPYGGRQVDLPGLSVQRSAGRLHVRS